MPTISIDLFMGNILWILFCGACSVASFYLGQYRANKIAQNNYNLTKHNLHREIVNTIINGVDLIGGLVANRYTNPKDVHEEIHNSFKLVDRLPDNINRIVTPIIRPYYDWHLYRDKNDGLSLFLVLTSAEIVEKLSKGLAECQFDTISPPNSFVSKKEEIENIKVYGVSNLDVEMSEENMQKCNEITQQSRGHFSRFAKNINAISQALPKKTYQRKN